MFRILGLIAFLACAVAVPSTALAQLASDERDILVAAGTYLRSSQPLPLILSSRPICGGGRCRQATDDRTRGLRAVFSEAAAARQRRTNEVVRTCPAQGTCTYSHAIVAFTEPVVKGDSAAIRIEILDSAYKSAPNARIGIIARPKTVKLSLVRSINGWQVVKVDLVRVS